MGKSQLINRIIKASVPPDNITEPKYGDICRQWQFNRILFNQQAFTHEATPETTKQYICGSYSKQIDDNNNIFKAKRYYFYGGFEIINQENDQRINISPKYASVFHFLEPRITDLYEHLERTPIYREFAHIVFGNESAKNTFKTSLLRLGPYAVVNVYELFFDKGLSLELVDKLAWHYQYPIDDSRRLQAHIYAAVAGNFNDQYGRPKNIYITQSAIRNTIQLSLRSGVPVNQRCAAENFVKNLNIPKILEDDEKIVFVAVNNANRTEAPILNRGEHRPGYTNYICLRKYVDAEINVANFLMRPTGLGITSADIDTTTIIPTTGKPVPADEYFQAAYKGFFEHPVMNVTGKAGTGKSTFVFSLVLKLVEMEDSPQIMICSFTGKAVRVLLRKFEASPEFTRLGTQISHNKTGKIIHVGTIHKLFYTGCNINDNTLVIIDEASMISLRTMNLLTMLCKTDAFQVIFVGDMNQLPPVDIGCVFREVLRLFPVYHLKTIHRTSGTAILHNADIVLGDVLAVPRIINDEFTWDKYLPETVHDACKRVATANDVENILLLAHRNNDVEQMNVSVQHQFAKRNNQSEQYVFGRKKFYIGDHVLATKNAYQHDIFNGDRGIVRRALTTTVNGRIILGLEIVFDSGFKELTATEIKDMITLAYACTIHKAQGSEAEHVILCVPDNNTFFNSTLLYTGITRAQKSVHVLSASRNILHNVRKADEPAMLMLDRRIMLL